MLWSTSGDMLWMNFTRLNFTRSQENFKKVLFNVMACMTSHESPVGTPICGIQLFLEFWLESPCGHTLRLERCVTSGLGHDKRKGNRENNLRRHGKKFCEKPRIPWKMNHHGKWLCQIKRFTRTYRRWNWSIFLRQESRPPVLLLFLLQKL